MCFSPEASFAGGIIISSIGVATITKIHNPSQIVFASIPLFFGVQQFAEGILWLTMSYPEYAYIQKFSTYFFLIMADVLWPVIIPLSVLFMEEHEKKKKILRAFLCLGLSLSGYYGYCLLFYQVIPEIICYHIHYNTNFPKSISLIAFMVYLTATIPPLFVSSIKRMNILGILMFLSCGVTAIFYTQFLTSVWCFFAALISGVIYWILRDSKRTFIVEKLKLLKTEFRGGHF